MPPPIDREKLLKNRYDPKQVGSGSAQERETIKIMRDNKDPEIVDEMVKRNRAMLAERHRKLKHFFELAEKTPDRKLPERVFIGEWLGFFSGEVKDNIPERLQLWTVIAGTQTARVGLTNEKGEVVAVVPPILETKMIKPNVGRLPAMQGLLQEAVQKSTQAAGAGEVHLAMGMRSRIAVMTEGIMDRRLDSYNEWSVLLERYGKTIPKDLNVTMDSVRKQIANGSAPVSDSAPVAAVDQKKTIDEDDLEWGD